MERQQNPSPKTYEAQLIYRIGDATLPPERPAIILHVVNDQGVWAKGFVQSLSQRFIGIEQSYYNMPRHLGAVHAQEVEPGLNVVHVCAQHGVSEDRYLSLIHLEEALFNLTNALDQLPERPTIHTIRIGQGMASGSAHRPIRWDEIEETLMLGFPGYKVYVYDLDEATYQSYQEQDSHAR